MRECPNCRKEIYNLPYFSKYGNCQICMKDNNLYSLLIMNEDKTFLSNCCNNVICYKCFSNLLKKPIRDGELSSGYITPPSLSPPTTPPNAPRK